MTEATVSTSSSFNRAAASYDAARRRLIPCFDDFYGTALRLIDDWRPSGPLKVLDLGAGTGLFSAMVLERRPDAHIHLIDAAEGMLAQARTRFAGNTAATFAVADMLTGDIGGPWDLVISALAIHHLEHDEKRALFRRIRGLLVPGGLFVNAEQVLGPDPVAEERYLRIWLEQIRELGATQEEIDGAVGRMIHDRHAPVGDQLRWMTEAGLTDVDCSFKAWRFAVLSGRAP